MDHDEPTDEDSDAIGLAAFFCYCCLPIAFCSSRLIELKFHTSWVVWLILSLFALIPITATFILLYASAWHQGWPKSKRILRAILASCAIFVTDILLLCWLTAMTSLHRGLGG
jgi:hypothetical protein